MSRIRADQILNSAGTGAPNFSQGLTGTTGTFSGNVSIFSNSTVLILFSTNQPDCHFLPTRLYGQMRAF